MKRDFNHWLQTLGSSAPVKSLTELIKWNADHKDAGAIKYGQAILEASDQIDLEKDRARYEADRAKDVRLAATHGIDEVLKAQSLDALVFSGGGGIVLGAKAGYPSITVPRSDSCRERHVSALRSGRSRSASLHRHRLQRDNADSVCVRV
jgi:amidase